jgi:hypothetical protein
MFVKSKGSVKFKRRGGRRRRKNILIIKKGP